MQFCGMWISKIAALPPKRDRLWETNVFVRWQVRYPVFKMWGHIFQTLVWFHGNVDQLKSFWWKGGRKVYNNMVASTDSPLISCSCLKDKVLLVAVRVAGERPNPKRDPNLTSHPCYGVRKRRTDPEKICYELMEHQWKLRRAIGKFLLHSFITGRWMDSSGSGLKPCWQGRRKDVLASSLNMVQTFQNAFFGGLFNVEHRAILKKKKPTFVLTGTKST